MQSRVTLRAVGLPSMQPQMDSAEVRRSRRTLLCISAISIGLQRICTSKAARVLETARCWKSRALVAGPPPQARHVRSPWRHERSRCLHEVP